MIFNLDTHIRYERYNKMLNVKFKKDTGEKEKEKKFSQKHINWKYCSEILKKDIADLRL